MKTGLMWQLPHKQPDHAAAIAEAMQRHRERLGTLPNVVHVHPGETFECTLRVVENAAVLSGCLWVGRDASSDERPALHRQTSFL